MLRQLPNDGPATLYFPDAQSDPIVTAGLSDDIDADWSFAGQMRAVQACPETISPDLAERGSPTAFLCTQRSAVPITHAVKAYYERLQEKPPYIGTVNTKDVAGQVPRLQQILG